jgi:hypothetical protein
VPSLRCVRFPRVACRAGQGFVYVMSAIAHVINSIT